MTAREGDLHVCTSCPSNGRAQRGGVLPGLALFRAIKERLRKHDAPALTLHADSCVDACDEPCAAVLRIGADTLLAVDLRPDDAARLLAACTEELRVHGAFETMLRGRARRR